MITLLKTQNKNEAMLLRELLQEKSVFSTLDSNHEFVVRGETPISVGRSWVVMVRDGDIEVAKNVADRFASEFHKRKPVICGNCEYDLRGSPGPQCPECGWLFKFDNPKRWICDNCEAVNNENVDFCAYCGEER